MKTHFTHISVLRLISFYNVVKHSITYNLNNLSIYADVFFLYPVINLVLV